MNYIPKYSRERQKKRQSQKYVTVLDRGTTINSSNITVEGIQSTKPVVGEILMGKTK